MSFLVIRRIRGVVGRVLAATLVLALGAGARAAASDAPPPVQAPSPGYGPAPYPLAVQARPPGAHTHDGFYLRLQLGLGYLGLSDQLGGQTLETSGVAGAVDVALGASLTRNLVLYGALFGSSISSPTFKMNGTAGRSVDGSAGVSGLGVGLAYYVMPENVYVAATLAACQAAVEDNSSTVVASTDLGPGVQVLLGKEWWASDNWGLGVSGQLILASMKDKPLFAGGQAPTMTAAGFSLLFSATYN